MVRNVSDPVSASKLLVDHALSRFSTDNLSCMIVRLDKEALLQSQHQKDVGVESDTGPKVVSEVDRIVKETKQKIADGSTPAVGVSASNSGRGHDTISLEEKEFVPTSLGGAVAEENSTTTSDDVSTGELSAPETAIPKTKATETKQTKDVEAGAATKEAS